MSRNLDRRVETVFPIEEFRARARVKEILDWYMLDNVKSRELNPDGTYSRVLPGPNETAVNVQEVFMALARGDEVAV
jgi:polyphosphate kinase